MAYKIWLSGNWIEVTAFYVHGYVIELKCLCTLAVIELIVFLYNKVTVQLG
jgi:hypothetical protein